MKLAERMARFAEADLYVVITEAFCEGRPALDVLDAVLEAGVRAVVDWNRTAKTQHEQFMHVGRSHVRNVAYSAREAFAVRDCRELEHVAELLRTPEDKDLMHVAFYTSDGDLLAAKTWPEGGAPPPAHVQPAREPASTSLLLLPTHQDWPRSMFISSAASRSIPGFGFL